MGYPDFGEVVMTELLEKNQLRLSTKMVRGRVANVIADILRKKLYIPNIYLSPKISGVPAVDILAVDRGGSGDLHAVSVKPLIEFHTRAQLRALLEEIKAQPFHFRYLALPAFLSDFEGRWKFAEYPELFDDTGIGRVGILSFNPDKFKASSFDATDAIKEILRPERFRVQDDRLNVIDKFLNKAKPDMEVRI
jgi:hypothetical protein